MAQAQVSIPLLAATVGAAPVSNSPPDRAHKSFLSKHAYTKANPQYRHIANFADCRVCHQVLERGTRLSPGDLARPIHEFDLVDAICQGST